MIKQRPTDRSLLEPCREPEGRLDGSRSLDENAPILLDVAAALEECQARHKRLVEWFD